MANGDQILSSADQVAFKLLDGQTSTTVGVWVEIPLGLNNKTFDSTTLEEGASDAQVEIHLNGGSTKPVDSANGHIASTLTTAVLGAENNSPWRWAKAEKVAGTTPIATTVVMNCAK